MSRPLAVVYNNSVKKYPCAACNKPLDICPYFGMTVDSTRQYYHPACLPAVHVLTVAPFADYTAKLHNMPYEGRDSWVEVTTVLDALLLAAYTDVRKADAALWWRDPELYVDAERVQAIVCPLCERVLSDPVDLGCEDGHVACRACWMIERLQSDGGSASPTVPCPCCQDDCAAAEVRAFTDDTHRCSPHRSSHSSVQHVLCVHVSCRFIPTALCVAPWSSIIRCAAAATRSAVRRRLRWARAPVRPRNTTPSARCVLPSARSAV